MPSNEQVIAKVQQSRLYFANLMDKYVDSFVFGIDQNPELNCQICEAFELLTAIEYQLSKDLYPDTDTTTLILYNKLDAITPIWDQVIEMDDTLIMPFISNTSFVFGPQGSQGPQGFQGAIGPQGYQGDQGPQGLTGDQGPQGNTGSQGVQGPQGFQGLTGPQGDQGVQGSVGAQGIQGPQGFQGSQGFQGPQGFQGQIGPQGIDGAQGPQGFQGTQGSTGPQGVQGSQGPQGVQGFQGPQGNNIELLTAVKNSTGSTLLKGSAVNFTGGSSGIPTVGLADANAAGDNSVIGILTTDILNDSTGYAMVSGNLSGIDLSSFLIGDMLWLSDTTPGGYTNDQSSLSFDSRSNAVGYVVDNSVSGTIHVFIENEENAFSLTTIQRNILNGNTASTGAFTFDGLVKASSTTFNVSPVQGWVVNNTGIYSTAPQVIYIDYAGATGVTTPYITTSDSTFVLIDSTGALLLQGNFPTPQQRRENIYLGKVIHTDRVSISVVNNTVDFDQSPMSALRDLFTPLKLINQGITAYPNGANKNINTTGGVLWGNGINFAINQLNPNSVSIAGQTAATFQYRTQASTSFPDTTTIDNQYYDLNGVRTFNGGGGGTATNQRIYIFSTGNIRIQYGQTVYTSLANAVSAISSELFVENTNIKDNGILIGILSVRKDATVLNDSTKAVFLPASKFGEVGSGTAGLSTTTLQQAYDNSSQPEILTNSTLDGLTIKRGSVSDSDSILNGQNGAGTQTFSVDGNGNVSGNSFIKTGGLSTQFLKADGSVDSSTYAIDSSVVHIAGTETITGLKTFQGTTATDSGQLGAELLTSSGWTSTGWTGSFGAGYTHTIGNTTALTNTLAAVNGSYYAITYTVTGRIAGTFTITFGGNTSSNTSATGVYYIRATSTGSLSIAPTTDFDGTIVFSIKAITASSATVTYKSSAGTITNELRASSIASNTFVGLNAGSRNITGIENTFHGVGSGQNNLTGVTNTFIGFNAGANNVSGNQNTFIGRNAGTNNISSANTFIGQSSGSSNTSGATNTFIGHGSGLVNTTGGQNVFIGREAGAANTTVSNNTYIGAEAGLKSTTGANNTFIGSLCGYGNTTGGSNVFIGNISGRYISDGATENQTSNNSILIGQGVRALSAGNTNQIVIGYNATGLGSNTTVIGNSSTVTTAIYGNLLLGTTTDALAKLQVSGSITAATAIARGAYFNNTLVASANNDVLVGLDITPTFTNGAFTGVKNIGLRLPSLGSTQSSITTSTAGDFLISGSGSASRLFLSGGGWTTSATTDGSAYIRLDGTSSGAFEFGFGQSSTLNLYSVSGIVFTSRFRIQGSNGNVQIGQTSDTGYKLDVNGTFRQTGSTTAASTIARGSYMTPTLIAAANNDVLVGLDIAPTFTNGSFTGVTNYALRVQGQQLNTGKLNLTGGLYSSSGIQFLTVPNGNTYDGINYSSGNISIIGSAVEKLRIFNNGNTIFQNGGTFTDAGYRLDVNGTARIQALATINSTIIGGTSLNSSAVAQIDSTTKGFLPPRMTSAQRTAIESPSVGLIVYQTDTVEGIYVYASTGWKMVSLI